MLSRKESPKGESGLLRLAALLRKDAAELMDENRDQLEWQRLLEAVRQHDERHLRKPRLSWMWMLAPAAACLVLVALGLYRGFGSSPRLRFQLDGREPSDAYVLSEAGRARYLEFSDGSRLLLRPSSSLRVIDTNSDGATLLLERGELELSIHHQPATRWQLDMGPYVVRVTGTRFNVTWSPDAGDMGVDQLEGSVDIRGPGIAVPIALQAGQQFRANKTGSFTVQRKPPSGAELPTPADATSPASRPDSALTAPRRLANATAPEHPTAPLLPKERLTCDWVGLVSKGDFEAALVEAESLGTAAVFSRCPPRSLFALADAARYSGRLDLSKNTLMNIRKRWPRQADKAAFFLGRLEEARGNSALALEWYAKVREGGLDPQLAKEAKAGQARMMEQQGTAPSP